MFKLKKTIYGEVEIIKKINNLPYSVGLKGEITAFIPKIKLFSIYFENEIWITLNWTIDKFNTHFKYQLFDKENIMKML